MAVYYAAQGGAIGSWSWNGTEWSGHTLSGSAIEAGTTPAVVEDAATADQWLYSADSGNIVQWEWDTTSWAGEVL